jgi:hypothetical protein
MTGITPVVHTNQQDIYEDIHPISPEEFQEECMKMRAIAEQSHQMINKHIQDTIAMAPPSPDFSSLTFPSINQALDESNIQFYERHFENINVYPVSPVYEAWKALQNNNWRYEKVDEMLSRLQKY